MPLKKSVKKKTPVKKSVAKKTATKKASVKKASTKKQAIKKTATKKTAVKKVIKKTVKPKAIAEKPPAFSAERKWKLISETAYFLAEKEKFSDNPLKYWLIAEKKIDALINSKDYSQL
jgi:hypothetical protein